ncbi:hypothetical protein Sjap_016186 [Stephania japonica]|uniref:Oleosin n=1 Tax=Stephania japonica TaxID=461633 RepID=A0AAP0IKL9_9MAGN
MADQSYQQRPGPKAGPGRPSTSQVLAVVTMVPVGGVLLTLSGLTFAGSLIGLALTTPLFVIFSPVIVPAAIAIALAVTGFLVSGAFGITALSSMTYIVNYLRGALSSVASQMGQKTKELGQGMQRQAPEGPRKV